MMTKMKRRSFLTLGAGIAAGLLRNSAQAAPKRKGNTPNIVLIFCDDMGFGDIGVNGAEGYSTPNIDRMAAEGMQFRNFYAGRSVCSPSRASLMTGCYPLRVGVKNNFGPKSRNGLHPGEMTIADVVKQKDYATAMYGKWHLGHLPDFLPIKQGFDEYYGLPYSNDMWPYHPDPRYNFPDLPLMEGEKILEYNSDQTKLTGEYTRRTIKFIKEHRDEPFFIYLAHAMPHVPLFTSKRFKGKTKRGTYGDVLEEIDWSVGQILKTLKKLDLDEDTLVIFTSDNGPWLLYGNHGGSAGPFREGKGTMFEGGMRVPCVMWWPGKIPGGEVCNELSSTIDILPTIAGLTGAPLPERKIDGLDIWPLMSGKPGAKTPHEVFYYYFGVHLQAVRSGKWKLHFPHDYNIVATPGVDGKHGKGAKVMIGLSLFDLSKDEGETTNLADKYPEVVSRLEKLAEEMRKELGDSAQNRPGPGIRELAWEEGARP